MKGKRIKIVKEEIGKGGVITATVQSATVLHDSGHNFNVKADDGYIYEIDRTNRDDAGNYLIIN